MEISEMIEILQRAEKGEVVECKDKNLHSNNWYITHEPIWDFSEFDYRIKPEPKRVPLTMQDLIDRELIGKTMRVKHGIACMLIQDFNDELVFFSDDEFSYEQLTSLEWIDNTPCYKEVECE